MGCGKELHELRMLALDKLRELRVVPLPRPQYAIYPFFRRGDPIVCIDYLYSVDNSHCLPPRASVRLTVCA